MPEIVQYRIRGPWKAVAAMFVLNGTLYGIWASRIPAIAEIHALEKSVLGLLLLMLAAGAILSFPLAGKASDRFGSAKITQAIAIFYAVALIALALSPNIWFLAFSLFLFGAGHGSMDVAMNAWAGEVEKHMARPVMSSFHAMWSVGAGLGAASGYIAVKMEAGPSAHFIIGAVFTLIVTLPWARIGWKSATHQPEPGSSLFPLPKGALAIAGIVTFCAAIGEGGMADWSALFLVDVALADDAIAALGFSVFSVAMVVMRFSADYIIVKTGPVLAARLGGALAALGSLIAIVVGSIPAIFLGFVLMGLGYAVMFPLAFSRAANDDKLAPGAAIASVATLGYGGLLLGPVIIGFLADLISLRLAFLTLSLLSLLIIVIADVLELPGEKMGARSKQAG